MRKPASVTAPTSPFGLSSLGKSDDLAMRRMVQAAPSVALHMPEATSALRSVHTSLLDADDAEPVEDPLPLVAELFDEHVVRCPSSEGGPRIAVQLRRKE